MNRARISAVVLAWAMAAFGPSNAVAGGMQDYCAAYAGQTASNKTGVPGEVHATTNEKWLGAYNTAFAACLDSYTPRASAAKASSPTEDERKQTAQQPKRKAQTRAQKARASKSKGRAAPARGGDTLCRQMQVDKKGGYRIRNCAVPKGQKRKTSDGPGTKVLMALLTLESGSREPAGHSSMMQ